MKISIFTLIGFNIHDIQIHVNIQFCNPCNRLRDSASSTVVYLTYPNRGRYQVANIIS